MRRKKKKQEKNFKKRNELAEVEPKNNIVKTKAQFVPALSAKKQEAVI